MPRNAKFNGIPPQVRALAVIKLGVPVTPSKINECVDTGNYASKWILYLKIMGFEFEVNKDGRNVVSYTMISEPKNAAELRAMQPKGSSVKTPAKSSPPKIIIVPKKPVNNLAKIKAAAEMLAAKTVPTVDPAWDSIDGIDIKKLV